MRAAAIPLAAALLFVQAMPAQAASCTDRTTYRFPVVSAEPLGHEVHGALLDHNGVLYRGIIGQHGWTVASHPRGRGRHVSATASDDGRWILMESAHATPGRYQWLYDMRNRVDRDLGLARGPARFAFSPDSRRLAAQIWRPDGAHFLLLDLERGETAALPQPSAGRDVERDLDGRILRVHAMGEYLVDRIRWSKDGRYLFADWPDKQVRYHRFDIEARTVRPVLASLWRRDTVPERGRGWNEPVTRLLGSHTGRFEARLEESGVVGLWSQGQRLRVLGRGRVLRCADRTDVELLGWTGNDHLLLYSVAGRIYAHEPLGGRTRLFAPGQEVRAQDVFWVR